jgi:predicted aconitase with swiveling domain
MNGRIIKSGHAKGEALVSREAMGWLGSVDPKTGIVVEKGHSLEGKNISGKVLVFTTGKGSTVGSYTIYALKKAGLAPAAIVCEESEPIVAVGAIISDIPMVDQIDISKINTGDIVEIRDGEVVLK